MTDTTTGTVEHLDPHTLTLETNVRPSAPLTPGFVQSIRHNGVLTPVLAHRTPDGTIHVRAGQRRTLAAREAGIATIPVYIVDADPAVTQRIIQQMIENDQREALTDADRAAAFQQLTFEGLDVPTIAKRTGTTPKDISTALTVAGNEAATAAIQEHALTLDQAADLIEFDNDEEVRADLIEVATHDPAQFAHAVQRARDEHTRAQVKADTEADLTARGFTILDRDRGYYDTDYTPLRDLVTADGDRATLDHIQVDGRAAFVRISYTGHPEVIYYLPDPKKAGLRKTNGQSSTGGPMTDEQKAERRTLIANNKAWASAEVVRREWLTTFLSRKTLPKDTPVVIARGLTIHRHAVSAATRDGNPLAHTLLGIDPAGTGTPTGWPRSSSRPQRRRCTSSWPWSSVPPRAPPASRPGTPPPPPTGPTSPKSPPGATPSATSNTSSPPPTPPAAQSTRVTVTRVTASWVTATPVTTTRSDQPEGPHPWPLPHLATNPQKTIWARYPRSPDQRGDHKATKHLVLAGTLNPESRWQYLGEVAA